MGENIKKETVKGKSNKVFISYEKVGGKSPLDADFDINQWEPRNNSVLLVAIKKKGNGLIIAGENNPSDSALFFVYKAGPLSGLQDKIGKSVVLRDYTPGISLFPVKVVRTEEEEEIDVLGVKEIRKIGHEEVYYLCFEHNIVLIEI